MSNEEKIKFLEIFKEMHTGDPTKGEMNKFLSNKNSIECFELGCLAGSIITRDQIDNYWGVIGEIEREISTLKK